MMKILLVAYHFPPQGGAGVQRALKFAKYFHAMGIDCTVLTCDTPPKTVWTPEDASLLAEVPPALRIHRIKWSREWDANALGEVPLSTLARPDIILATVSPFADCRLAQFLSVQLRAPWVADLRDPWALDEFQIYRHRWQRKKQEVLMRQLLLPANGIVMNTPTASLKLQNLLPDYPRERVVDVTNGFDSSDFTFGDAKHEQQKFRIVHSGLMHTNSGFLQRRAALKNLLLGQWEHGLDVMPRSHFYLIKALELACERKALDRALCEAVFIGTVSKIDREIAEKSKVADLIRFTGYVDHAESVRELAGASILFLPMHQVAGGKRASIVPGKTYEYLATDTPILAAVPDGDAKDFLSMSGGCYVVTPDDATNMANALIQAFERWKAGERQVRRTDFVQQFERKKLAEKMVKFLADIISKKSS